MSLEDRTVNDLAKHALQQIDPVLKRHFDLAHLVLDPGQLASMARIVSAAISAQLVGVIVGMTKDGSSPEMVFTAMQGMIADSLDQLRPHVVAKVTAERAARTGRGA